MTFYSYLQKIESWTLSVQLIRGKQNMVCSSGDGRIAATRVIPQLREEAAELH